MAIIKKVLVVERDYDLFELIILKALRREFGPEVQASFEDIFKRAENQLKYPAIKGEGFNLVILGNAIGGESHNLLPIIRESPHLKSAKVVYYSQNVKMVQQVEGMKLPFVVSVLWKDIQEGIEKIKGLS